MVEPVESSRDLTEKLHISLNQLTLVSFLQEDEQGSNLLEFFSELVSSYPIKVFSVKPSQSTQSLFSSYSISRVPTTLFLTGFEEQGRVEGSNIPDLLSKTENHSSLFSSVFESLRNSYYSTLQVLINSSKLVVFTQEESSKSLRNRKIRRILNGYLYETIQVDKKKHLSDWLRVYSSSKTFPMVFLGGRFQGSIEEIMKNISTGDFSTAMGEDLNEKLSRIVKSSKYIVFMMGSKEEPICGYSKRLIALLDGYGIDFDTFDISFDGEVCEGLKKFSDWPTYPQVYVDGELIGGYDICNQMHNEGSLKQALGIPE